VPFAALDPEDLLECLDLAELAAREMQNAVVSVRVGGTTSVKSR